VPWQAPPLPPPDVAAADSADELRRQAEKARIRERILREEAEHLGLELEVRREIREDLLRLSWPAFGRSAGGSSGPPARIVSGNASLPVATHDEVRCPSAFFVFDDAFRLFVHLGLTILTRRIKSFLMDAVVIAALLCAAI